MKFGKGTLRAIVIIGIVIVAMIIFARACGIQGAKLKVMEEQAKVDKATISMNLRQLDKVTKEKDTIIADEQKLRKKAEVAVVKLKTEKTRIIAENVQLKEDITTATDDEVVVGLNSFFGDYFTLTNDGYFRTTRLGAKLTLAKFHDTNKFEGLYNAQVEITKKEREKLKSYKREIKLAWEEKEKAWQKKYDGQVALTEIERGLYKQAKRTKMSNFVKGVGTGFGVALIVDVVASVLKR